MDKIFVWHVDYKVVVATADPGGKIVGPAIVGFDLVAAKIDLVDIRVGLFAERVFLAIAIIVGKALVVHKVLVVKKVVIVEKFLVELTKF